MSKVHGVSHRVSPYESAEIQEPTFKNQPEARGRMINKEKQEWHESVKLYWVLSFFLLLISC